MNEFHVPVAYRISGISLLILLVLCALASSIMGCDGGVGEVAAVDAVATDAAATAATDVAAEAATAAVTETAIAGSTDIALDVGGDISTVEPFSSALGAGDGAGDMAVGLSGADPDGSTITELNNHTTGELQMVALTTRSIYRVEKAFLDVQHNRLIVQAIEKRGDTPSWGFFKLGDKAVSELERTKQLKFTGSDGSPMIFERPR
ncbi:MAG TPA: hypothetical protein VHX86_06315 [Tepidisphaeraceae bacterium]|jgi:hypothetical protein|nr:hypothetical protein [Tepidisphaeraceae bacterium]